MVQSLCQRKYQCQSVVVVQTRIWPNYWRKAAL